MNRREILQRAALVLGYAVTGPALVGVMNGCKAVPELAFKPTFFSPDQAQLISALSELIIPATDTPGAIAAGVPAFIDQLVKQVYSRESQELFVKNMESFDSGCKDVTGNRFSECSKDEQTSYYKKLHDAALKEITSRYSAGFWNAAIKDSKPFVIEIKELTLLGFFTSEPGATQVLQYKQVPGPYRGCVPLSEVGKTWAT